MQYFIIIILLCLKLIICEPSIQVLPLFAEIDDDKKFTSCFGVLNFGMVAVMMLNVPLGMTGYSKWGEEVKSSLTLNLPLDHE